MQSLKDAGGGIDWKQLHKDAGYKKYLRKLTVAAAAAGIEKPNEWAVQVDVKSGIAMFFHVPTVTSMRQKPAADASPKPDPKGPGADGAAV